jgi:hypothetical protein
VNLTRNRFQQLFLVVVFMFICSCGGRLANPVSVQRPQDAQITCPQIDGEINQIRYDISELYSQATTSRKRNVIFNLLSSFFPPAYVLSDVHQAEKVEINAFRKRHNYLVMLATDKGCGEGKFFLDVEEQCKDFYTLNCIIPSGDDEKESSSQE